MIADKAWLFVPAKEKYITKIADIEGDVLILDLEDALTQNQKTEGLRLVTEAVKEHGQKREIYVRVNADERLEEELKTLQSYQFAGYMIPKFEDSNALEIYHQFFKGKEIIALIESIRGTLQIEKSAAHPLVNKMAFGGEDFCRELGFEAGEEATLYARSRLVMYAAYYQKYSLDTICLEFKDREMFLREYSKTKRFGFQGKLLIHPNQVKMVQDYTKDMDIAYLKNILEIYQRSKEGIIQVDGRIYERPHITKIEKYLRDIGVI